MEQTRFELLKRVYDEAIDYNNMYEPLLLENEDYALDLFNLQYLEASGLIELENKDNRKGYVTLTLYGVDFVEDALGYNS
ncbi:hypothetical protein F0342_06855 [Bacillus sp. CH30_1T]|uniref:hypothetical protein n=1 Tax=Bacillus sp. CH30_1T TaxID=2604836 RepID=UPI0011EE02B8|nr:hypothetical protein [Bacillus sp. CH30_1T]KAA0565322.1 hypothetical protein F0342_06855 [Bacillus sp. CH30_1T]